MNSALCTYIRKVAPVMVVLAGTVSISPGQTGTDEGGYSTWGLTLFGGYQRARQTGNLKIVAPPVGSPGGIDFSSGPVGGAALSQDFSKYLGLEEGYTWTRLPSGFSPYVSGTRSTFNAVANKVSVNPVLNLMRREARVRPYGTVGFAAIWFDPGTPTVPLGVPERTKMLPSLLYGVGVKVHMSRRIGLRFEARNYYSGTPHYVLPDYPPAAGAYFSPKGTKLNQVEVTGGLIFRWGYHEPPPVARAAPPPPPPPVVEPPKPPAFTVGTLTASATGVCPGPTVELRAETADVPAGATYRWTINGSPINATGSTASVPTTGLSGTQTVVLTIQSGDVTRTATTSFTVRPLGNPTITVAASPSTVQRGGNSTIAITATASECGGTVRTTCTASEGTVNGTTFDSSAVAFDPNATRAQSKTVTITCTTTDSNGATATATTPVAVTEKPTARRLEDLVFSANNSRVNNCAKRVLLEELTPMLRENPDWTVVLLGHRDEQERGAAASRLDTTRALNAAAVLSAGSGICPQLDLSRVKIGTLGTDQSTPTRPGFCGSSTNIKERPGQAVTEADGRAQFRRVEVWVIPAGADTPNEVRNATDAPAAAVKALGCPR